MSPSRWRRFFVEMWGICRGRGYKRVWILKRKQDIRGIGGRLPLLVLSWMQFEVLVIWSNGLYTIYITPTLCENTICNQYFNFSECAPSLFLLQFAVNSLVDLFYPDFLSHFFHAIIFFTPNFRRSSTFPEGTFSHTIHILGLL